MLTADFYGKKSFIWWTGVVEDVDDPLKLGSVRVRIIGIHPFEKDGKPDKSLVATENLPWAQVSLPPTGSKTTSGPRVGDWVWGFFQDGDFAQIPIVLGTYPGIHSQQAQIVYTDFVRTRTVPTAEPPRDIIVRNVNEPTTARLARGVMDNTLVNRTNNQLAHVCDISAEVRLALFYFKQAFGPILDLIRQAVRALIASLGLEPSGEIRKVIKFLQELAAEIRKAVDYYNNNIKPYIELVIKVIRLLRAMIDYILSLPERLARFLLQCLSEFRNAIVSEFKNFIGGLGNDAGLNNTDFAELIQSANDVIQASESAYIVAIEATTAPARFVEAFVNPNNTINNLQQFELAATEVGSLVSATAQDPQTVKNQLQITKSKGP